MTFFRAIISTAFFGLFMVSCGESDVKNGTDSLPKLDSLVDKMEMATLPVSQNVEAKTFEVIDSLGKSHGWGYDLYIDGKKTIHQPIIPSLPGNNSFQTEADALKMGQLASARMKSSGSLPTMYPHDVDSLGIAVSKYIRHYLDSLSTVQSKNTYGK